MLRPTSQELNTKIGEKIPVLDHGFIRLIDYMGDDASIVQAARVSYGAGTKTSREDEGLIRYLMKHKHTSPFEMCEIKLHVKLPIFIARQWVRHRTANINEYSARYSIMPCEFYLPDPAHIASQSKNNKQGRGDTLSPEDAAKVIEILKTDSEKCYENYQKMIGGSDDGEDGLARELARMNLTLNFYTEWYWKVDLHNLLHFLALRLHPHAQMEIRLYAEAIASLVKIWCPLTFKAFEDYTLSAKTFSGAQIDAIKSIIAGKKLEELNLSKREKEEISNVLGINF